VRTYKSLVKCYQRQKSKQYLITLKGDHGFKPDETVIILHETDFKELEELLDISREHKDDLILKDKEILQLNEDLSTAREELQDKTRSLVNLEARLKVYEDNQLNHKEELQALKDKELQYIEETREHQLRIKELERLQGEDYQGKYNKLRNKHDHLQERLNKSLEETNKLQKVITDLSNRGFIDYITGRLPESFKQLQAPEVKLNKEEDGGT
jgi:chromosome segregation ATPase